VTDTVTLDDRLPATRTHSLNDVRAIIPEACYQRSNVRAALALLQAFVLYALPIAGLALTNTWWAVLLLWGLAGMAVSGLFVLGHDASHGALVESRRLNRLIAQICMVPSFHVEAAWDLGHNRIHHGYTTRQGFDFVWHPATPDEYRAMGRLARVQHRFEWSRFGSGAYFLRTVWWQKMWRFNAPGKRRDAIVRDKIVLSAVLALLFAGAATWGAFEGGVVGAFWMPFKLLVVPFLIFTQVIGWTVYVHHVAPDIRWWPRKEWSQFKGQMESTTIMRVNPVVNKLWLHNIMVHVPHHVDARLPFHKLPLAAAAIAEHYPDTVRSAPLSLRSYAKDAAQCKLYDFEAGRWLGYAEATA
jgi:omega-6 fatty acid desaturase (delta-12 desaturase)